MYRITYNELLDKWTVIDEDYNTIMYSTTKEGAKQIMDDLNGS